MATDADTDAETGTVDAYDELTDRLERLTAVQGASGVLSWDQQVTMPEGGTPARSKQLSVLSSVSHEMLTDDRTAELLDACEGSDLTGQEEAVVRETRREYERAAAVPGELVEEISSTSSEALGAWEEARENDDFETFAPYLEDLVELKREYAEQIDPDRDPYAVLFEDYEPCLPLSQAEEILDTLKETLVPMIDEIRESDADVTTDAFEGTFDADEQEALSRDVLTDLGYDWEHGRLDVSSHPFTSGNQFDCRVTTRFDESDPLGALMSTVHEFGHAFYNLGLPREQFGTPLGESRDLSVHESQSRLWENQVGRSAAFWEHVLPTVREQFPDVDASAEEAYESANQVYEDNLIRVEADELTYHLHIVIRFEIERALIAGDLDVADVPEAWNDKYEEYLGLRPDTDSEGCLQDIHWSHGNFGYFPTYSLGSVLATQLYDAADDDIDDLEGDVRNGEFGALHDWLRENVHRHGARYETNELVERATGEPFGADHFVEYVREKYGDLYDLDESV
ncbi:carboxypeptidase M32 [Candidatus Halobonum tyrrellensis]|uniref:Metal-dependent carboxypeptidase n=1 Tax=Candidatus Halobonum tyrrellensis G22 TaxID=1324957 RepID=V4HJR4_9EURY|nr:carboxypeptidase M32 [Candidatus Halobonum tyrrellensis]ESP88159.1 carboxypeptidase Taq [Candidatus Halobonum tyrrellensis G22]